MAISRSPSSKASLPPLPDSPRHAPCPLLFPSLRFTAVAVTVTATTTATATMKFTSLRRSSSDRIITSPEDVSLRSSARPRLYLRSLGFSPGRHRILQEDPTVVSSSDMSSSTVSLRIHRSEPSSSAAVRSLPESLLANRLPESRLFEFLIRGEEEGGSEKETASTYPWRESEPIPIYPPPVATGAITAARNKKGSTNPISGPSMGAIEEKEYIWANKHRPTFLSQFICNKDRAEELVRMVNSRNYSHLIFEGPPGVGKRTMALATLRSASKDDNLYMKTEKKKFELKGEFVTSIEVNVKLSSQHVEVNLTDLHGYEKHVLVALMSEYHTPEGDGECDQKYCKVVVVHDADRLSTDSQHYVRWLMEKYQGCNKVFFCCSEASKLHIIQPLCKIVKLQPPSTDEIIEVLKFIAIEESIDLPKHMAEKFAENSKNNLRQAIRSFEASWKSNYSVNENQDILTGWEDDIARIAKSIVEEQSPRQLYIIRGKLKNLIEYDVSPDFIFSTLVDELKKHLDEQLHAKTDALYEKYRNSPLTHHKQEDSDKLSDSKKNVRYFMRIEEFTAKFMSCYKSIIAKNAAGPNTIEKNQCF